MGTNDNLHVNDRVELSFDHTNFDCDDNPVSIKGTVRDANFAIHVEWDNGGSNCYLRENSDLILVSERRDPYEIIAELQYDLGDAKMTRVNWLIGGFIVGVVLTMMVLN